MKKEKTQGEFSEPLCRAQNLLVCCLTDHNILGPEVAIISVKTSPAANRYFIDIWIASFTKINFQHNQQTLKKKYKIKPGLLQIMVQLTTTVRATPLLSPPFKTNLGSADENARTVSVISLLCCAFHSRCTRGLWAG